MRWYEEIMEAAQEAVSYIGAALHEGNERTETSQQILTEFTAAMDGIAEYLSREEGTLIEKCRRYALNAAHSAQKVRTAETADEARRITKIGRASCRERV